MRLVDGVETDVKLKEGDVQVLGCVGLFYQGIIITTACRHISPATQQRTQAMVFVESSSVTRCDRTYSFRDDLSLL